MTCVYTLLYECLHQEKVCDFGDRKFECAYSWDIELSFILAKHR